MAKNVKKRDLEISEIPNIDEVGEIRLATSRELLWSKIELPDDMIILDPVYCNALFRCCPRYTYTFSFGDFHPAFLKKNLYERHLDSVSDKITLWKKLPSS